MYHGLDVSEVNFATLEPTFDPGGDVNGYYVRTLADHTGLFPDDLVGKHIPTDIYPDEDRNVRAMYQRVLETGHAVRFQVDAHAAGAGFDILAFRISDKLVGSVFHPIVPRCDQVNNHLISAIKITLQDKFRKRALFLRSLLQFLQSELPD